MEYLLSPGVERALSAAQIWAARLGSEIVQLTHFILALLEEEEGRVVQLLRSVGVSVEQLREQLLALPPSPSVPSPKSVLTLAREWSLTYRQDPQVLTDALLLAVLEMDPDYAATVAPLGLDLPRLQAALVPSPLTSASTEELSLLDRCTSAPPHSALSTSPPTGPTSQHTSGLPLVKPPASSVDPANAPTLNALVSASSSLPLLRVLDANSNRAREALRVLEDYCRFICNDAALTEEVKTLRHEFAHWEQRLPLSLRLAARDTPADVGTSLTASGEYVRESLTHVCQINLKRLQEALRSLEEYSKLLDATWARQVEQLRYRVYHLETRLLRSSPRQQRLAQARLYWLFTPSAVAERWEWLLERALLGGVQMVQLREKQQADRTCLQIAQTVRRRCQEANVLFLVNDRPDLALMAEADGVHLGQDDLPISHARRLLSPETLIGVSTHNLEQVQRAWQEGADYIGVGPVFPSSTKAFEHFPGLEFVRQAVAVSSRRPAFSLGGITLENLPQVLAAGARRIAVSACLSQADDPARVAQQLRAILDTFPLSDDLLPTLPSSH